MTSKERVRAALACKVPDRVPLDYAANAGIDRRLKQYFGLQEDDSEGLLRALGVDFRGIWIPYKGPKLHAAVEGMLVDELWGFRTRWVEHETGGYYDYCDFPLKNATLAEVEAWPMPSPDNFDYSHVAAECKKFGEYGVSVYGGYGDIINGNGFLRGMEQTLIDLVTDEPAGLLLAHRRVELVYQLTRRALEAANGGIDFIWLGEDLGTQRGPVISLELFRKHIRPRYEPFCELSREFNVPVMVHTCGSSSWAYEDFIEMGIKAVDTLQPEAANMSPRYLKDHFGGRLAFHGCISTAGPVAYGTVDDVVNDVRDTLKIMMPGGGYCLAPTHCLQDNSPTENVVAMYEAARKYGKY